MYREMVKAKTAAKKITYGGNGGNGGDDLKKVVLDTVKKASQLVGSTLGPNGRVVLIERQEKPSPFYNKGWDHRFQFHGIRQPNCSGCIRGRSG